MTHHRGPRGVIDDRNSYYIILLLWEHRQRTH